MAQLAIAAAGAAVGFAVGGPGGAQIGWAVGSMVGAQFGPKQKSHGPRLEDLRVTGSEYGQTIPWAAGHPRIAGQVWWASSRREIGTTTSQGKGGGGAESTSYTYEVDILYGLINRPITAVTRIWANGKLIFTNLGLSDDDSVANSADNPNWERITVYTGAADQLPDPTYEAAVTNATAYRGRGSVFIEGLQLGNSGVIPNLTFEVAIDAVETPAAMQLLCNFAGGSTADVSPYLLGNATQTGPGPLNFSDGVFSFTQKITDNNRVSWTAPGLKVQSQPLTVEFIFRVDAITPIPPSVAIQIARYTPDSGAPYSFWDFNITGAISGQNRLQITPPDGSFFSVTDNINGLGFPYHVAIVFKADGTYDYYLHGRKVTPGGNSNPSNNANSATISLGGTGQTTQQTLNSYYDVRITKEEIYSADFTPPTELGPFTATFDLNDDTLQNVVEDLCDSAGMPAGTYDATALASITKPVRAFVLSQIATSRSAIEQLMAAYFFESYLTDKLYFVPRAGSVLDTIDADDMGAGLESPEDETLPTQVGSDLEIPAQVSLSYSNVDADYTTATEHSDRLLSGQVSTSAVQLPLAFTSAEAKGIADAIVVDGYASRVTGTFSVPLAYAELTPTDVVTVPDADGNTYRVRIVRRTDEGPLLRFEWVLDDATAIESAGITSDDYTPTVGVALPGDTLMELLDVPLMRDAENTLGHYVAATSAGTTWPGASISRSLDDVEFSEAARVSERAILGATTTTLGNWTGGKVFDEQNSVTVSLSYGTLSSSTRSAMMADASINAIMIGAELIRFRTATFVSTGVYTLSGLLRGQRGTEWAMSGHTASDRVVLMQSAGMRYVAIDLPSLSAVRYYKGVTLGKSLASVDSEAFTCEGVSLKPLAPVNLRAARMSNGDVLFTWNRRTRVSATFTGAAGIVVPLGEVTEAYEFSIYNDAGMTSLVRSLDVAEQQARYTVAHAQADGDVTRSVFFVVVRQIGVVDGYAQTGSFSVPISSSVSTLSVTDAGVFGTFDGALVAMDGGPDGISFLFRTMTSSDDGATFAVSQSGAVATGYPAGVKCWMVATASRRLQMVYSQDAAVRYATYVDDNTSTPTKIDPGPTSSGANITPYALAVDATATPFRLIGRPSTATYGAQDFYSYKSADGITWTLVGQVTQDGTDPNTLAAGTFGALQALSFSPDYPAYQTASLSLIGSRWFLAGTLGVYYTDDADAQINWRRCPTGLGEGGSPTTSLGGVVQIGARLLAVRRHTYGSGVSASVSSDNGVTWTAYRPNAQGTEELGEMFVHGGDVYISAPTGATPRFLRSSTGLQSSWSVVNGAGIDGSIYRFRSSGSNILATNNTTIGGGGGVFRIVYSPDGGLNWNVSQIT